MTIDTIFANLATGFSEAFGAPFVEAVAVWPGTPVKDAGGSITSPGVPQNHNVTVQFDVATQAMRLAEGFLQTDVRILILNFGRSLMAQGGENQAKIIVGSGERAGTWSLFDVQRDPAGIGWEARGRKVQ